MEPLENLPLRIDTYVKNKPNKEGRKQTQLKNSQSSNRKNRNMKKGRELNVFQWNLNHSFLFSL